MIASLLTALLLLAQAPPASPDAAPPPPSPRLETALMALKGQPKAAFTARLGPPGSIRPATDGEVLFWTINAPGETVCGAGPGGALACERQGGGDCIVAVAFTPQGAMSVWRTTGAPSACDKAADQLKPAG